MSEKRCEHCLCQSGPVINMVYHLRCCKCDDYFATAAQPPTVFPTPPVIYPTFPPQPTVIWCNS